MNVTPLITVKITNRNHRLEQICDSDSIIYFNLYCMSGDIDVPLVAMDTLHTTSVAMTTMRQFVH